MPNKKVISCYASVQLFNHSFTCFNLSIARNFIILNIKMEKKLGFGNILIFLDTCTTLCDHDLRTKIGSISKTFFDVFHDSISHNEASG